ncbi:hypothetical protein GGU10DRAFT_347958 [Lentinula aff. detonsa]|uniref:Uncharacterized protein n=1 Tax=Lentinula aff. detonsa TaxID=2804958 RepID=A0AA38NN44_9AGAR|nr:hypothetical protein GGU10DRAFT_347958 [Lentinula aff. detonsa]
MMVFSRSVLTTFIVVGTSSSVLALPFQSFSGLPQNDVTSTATTQAMPTIPTGYVQGQSVSVQEDAVKNHNGASNSLSPSGLARRILMDARTLDDENTSEKQSAIQRHLAMLAQLSKTTKTSRPLPDPIGEDNSGYFGSKSNNPGNPTTSSGSDQRTRRDLFDTRNADIIESPIESSSFVPGSSPSPSSHPTSSPTRLPLANDHHNTRSIYGEDLD